MDTYHEHETIPQLESLSAYDEVLHLDKTVPSFVAKIMVTQQGFSAKLEALIKQIEATMSIPEENVALARDKMENLESLLPVEQVKWIYTTALQGLAPLNGNPFSDKIALAYNQSVLKEVSQKVGETIVDLPAQKESLVKAAALLPKYVQNNTVVDILDSKESFVSWREYVSKDMLTVRKLLVDRHEESSGNTWKARTSMAHDKLPFLKFLGTWNLLHDQLQIIDQGMKVPQDCNNVQDWQHATIKVFRSACLRLRKDLSSLMHELGGVSCDPQEWTDVELKKEAGPSTTASSEKCTKTEVLSATVDRE